MYQNKSKHIKKMIWSSTVHYMIRKNRNLESYLDPFKISGSKISFDQWELWSYLYCTASLDVEYADINFWKEPQKRGPISCLWVHRQWKILIFETQYILKIHSRIRLGPPKKGSLDLINSEQISHSSAKIIVVDLNYTEPFCIFCIYFFILFYNF